MRAFSQLLDDLVYTRSRNSKLKLIGDYLKTTPDPDRGIALAALTGTLDIPAVKPAQVRAMVDQTNAQRRALYQQIAQRERTTVEVVQQRFGERLVRETPRGQFAMDAGGRWVRR